jgi:hypothetical protein
MLPDHIRAAINDYCPRMTGFTTAQRCCDMAELIIDNLPNMVVEIGVFGGRTMLAQAFALREVGRGIIFGIDAYKFESCAEGERKENRDYWQNIDFGKLYLEAASTLFDHRLAPHAVLVQARSQDVAYLFQSIDILNIDGCHSEVASLRDVELYLPRVRQGGYIWFDDIDWTDDAGKKTTVRAQEMIEQQCDVLRVEREANSTGYKLYRKRVG